MCEYKDIYKPLKMLYVISKKGQAICDKQSISAKAYLKEFCTIRIMTCRRGGHDYGIVRFLYEEGLSTLIISPNLQLSRMIQETYKNFSRSSNTNIKWATFHNYREVIMGLDTDMIIINNSFLLSKKKEEDIYDTAIVTSMQNRNKNNPFYIVFVQ